MAARAVVFDFDGVLADSEPLHFRAYQEVLSDLGIEISRAEYYQRYLGFDDVGAFKAVAEARGQRWTGEQIAALVARKTQVFDAMMVSTDVLYPGAAECVERLAASLPLGIASGALAHEIRAILRRAGLERHFRFVVASGDTPRSKPAPDPYLRAVLLHGLPASSCVAIEDSRWGIESARTAGLRCVGISTTYGREELTAADSVISSLGELTIELIETVALA